MSKDGDPEIGVGGSLGGCPEHEVWELRSAGGERVVALLQYSIEIHSFMIKCLTHIRYHIRVQTAKYSS